MSYFEDYVQDGLCCEGCGVYLGGDEPGYIRRCPDCRKDAPPEMKPYFDSVAKLEEPARPQPKEPKP